MGHHLNDQLETFIINLSKAAGTGLSGIPENSNKILRPLLHITKADIYKFAEENGVISGRIIQTKAGITSGIKSGMTFPLKWKRLILIFGRILIKVYLISVRQKTL
jgi:hypothetical protein